MASVNAGLGTGTLVAAQTGTTTTDLIGIHATGNYFPARSLIVVVNVSAFTSGTLTLTLNGISSSNFLFNILTSAALAATGVTALTISPSVTVVANVAVSAPVPNHVQIVATSAAFVGTYSLDYILTP